MGEAKTGLIDFLYKDLSRIESLFAQLFHGSLKEIAATESFGTSGNGANLCILHYCVKQKKKILKLFTFRFVGG